MTRKQTEALARRIYANAMETISEMGVQVIIRCEDKGIPVLIGLTSPFSKEFVPASFHASDFDPRLLLENSNVEAEENQ